MSNATDQENATSQTPPPPPGPSAEEDDWADQLSHQFEENIGKPSREAIHTFFYPPRSTSRVEGGSLEMVSQQATSDGVMRPQAANETGDQQAAEDRKFVEHFWTTYDDILILSLFTQLGILFRLGASFWFSVFDNVFSADSALFVNLPLNCLSCFLMGILCSGENLMEIVGTRFSPPRLQQQLLRSSSKNKLAGVAGQEDDGEPQHYPSPSGLISSPMRQSVSGSENDDEDDDDDLVEHTSNVRRRRRRRRRQKKNKEYFHYWEPPVRLNEDLRDVQLLALERRIRASKCLLLFPVRKQDVDVMEHYFQGGYKGKRGRWDHDDGDHSSEEENEDFGYDLELQATAGHQDSMPQSSSPSSHSTKVSTPDPLLSSPPRSEDEDRGMSTVALDVPEDAPQAGSNRDPLSSPDSQRAQASDDGTGDNAAIPDVTADVMENVNRLRRVNIADGWDAGTSAEAMSDDLMLGLRAGFCGALSSFSSWNSSMVNLMRQGKIGEAAVGYMLGIQLPIIAYRFGQHIAVYIFVWRCRFESRRDERRGYGIRLSMNDQSERRENGTNPLQQRSDDEMPSVRAIVTAIFIMATVTQITSLSFYSDSEQQQIALSLLFSPLGVLARWRLSQFNSWRPTFPLGTFIANILACALSGGLGSLLAGNPGPRERIALVSFVAGFGGTLSSLAAFIVEILAGIDPVLFRFDGMIYAILSIIWAMVVGFIFSASVDWADATE